MSLSAAAQPPFTPSGVEGRRVRWRWILSRRADLLWYIGSSALGWLYVVLVLGLGRGMKQPMNDPIFTIGLGAHRWVVNLELLVVFSWAFLVDAPHVWATLARTYLDPAEWTHRRRALLLSFGWFLAGPIAVLAPYALAKIVPLPAGALGIGGVAFTVFFRLWAYYHVVRQHWGFLVLYQRKGGDADPREARADKWFFNLSLYLPLLMFMSAPWYPETPFPPTGFHVKLFGDLSIASLVHPICWALYPAALLGYAGFQFARWRAGAVRNGPKLLFLASIVPLHLAVFLSPLLALFIVPIVTVGHNLQYHRIVWTYGQRTYANDDSPRARWTRPIFRSAWLYFALGLVFTFAWYRGPWIGYLEHSVAGRLDGWLVGGLGLISGTENPTQASLGSQIASWFIAGWAMQHYFLDARIWRVSRDARVARSLQV